MKSIAFTCLILFALLSTHSCDRTVFIDFEADPAVGLLLISDIHSIPLPDGLAFSGESAAEDRISVVVAITSPDNPLPFASTHRSEPKLLRRRWYVPVVRYTSTLFDTQGVETGADIPLFPLDELTLPSRGLSVDGMYPGDDGYPYFEDTVVFLAGSEHDSVDEKTLASLGDWIDLLPGKRDDPEITWIAAVGDMMPGRGVSQLLAGKNGLEKVFADTLPILRGAGLTAGNLEGAVTTDGARSEKSYTFKFKPEVLESLRKAGFDYLAIANNHSYDFGEIGFLDTLKFLADSGIATSGAGIDPASASVPSVFMSGDQEIRVLSIGAYPPERNGFDGEETASVGEDQPGILWANDRGMTAVEAAFSDESFDVLLVHGGVEWSTEPDPEQQNLYRQFIELGADAVIGSHSHVLQGIDVHDGGLIAYSLGNFIFPGMEETAYGEESLILLLGITGQKIRYIEMVPVAINGTTIGIDSSGTILSKVLDRSKVLE